MTLSALSLEVASPDRSPLPIDLNLIKTHCAVDGSDFDSLLTTYLFAAIHWAEGAMHRTIFARYHKWVLRDFPYSEYLRIHLPRGKTLSVEGIDFVRNDQTFTLTGPSSGSPAGNDYREDLTGDDGGVIHPIDWTWPSVDCEAPAPVTIRFTAGWQASEVPDDIIHALLFAVSDAFEMRSEIDMSGGSKFQVREALISPYRLVRFYA